MSYVIFLDETAAITHSVQIMDFGQNIKYGNTSKKCIMGKRLTTISHDIKTMLHNNI